MKTKTSNTAEAYKVIDWTEMCDYRLLTQMSSNKIKFVLEGIIWNQIVI
jgi:hypothetical protein